MPRVARVVIAKGTHRVAHATRGQVGQGQFYSCPMDEGYRCAGATPPRSASPGSTTLTDSPFSRFLLDRRRLL
jgi:hypothetical protein